MTYGMLASGSCLLTDIVDHLHENAKKVNSVEHLTRHLNNGISDKTLKSYLTTIRTWVPKEPLIHIDDSDVIKNHPISIFSRIHSSMEKNFTSINNITFSAMARGAALFGKATFVMDRGYDDNKLLLKLDELKQDYVIRLTAKRKLFFHRKWIPAT